MGSTSYRMCLHPESSADIGVHLVIVPGCSDECSVELGNGVQEVLTWFQNPELSRQHKTTERASARLE